MLSSPGVAARPEPSLPRPLDLTSHALFLDVDGTLIDIAPHPDAVVVPEGLVGLLDDLSRQLDGALALVSGRTLARLDALFAPLRLPAAGIHGGELRLKAEGPVRAQSPAVPAPLRVGLDALGSTFPGVFAEDKGTAIAVHYRAAPEVGADLGRAIAALVAAEGEGFCVLPGHMVFEVKAEGHDKGTAVETLLEQPGFRGRVPVFVGDDVTDEAGFRAARAHGGAAISVGRPLAGVDAVMADAGAVRAWLASLADAAGTRR